MDKQPILDKRLILGGASALLVVLLLSLHVSKPESVAVSSESVAVDAASDLTNADLTDSMAVQSNGLSNGLDGGPAAPSSAVSPEAKIPPTSLRAPTPLEQEKQTLSTLTSILFEQSRQETSPAELVKRLEADGYQPVASRDDDDATGSMIVVQTKNALPGSRYFRAQFFSDEEGLYQPQHVSFELRPGTPIKSVVTAMENQFGHLGTPTFQNKEWMSWKLSDHRGTVWIKTVTQADIEEGDAIKARSQEDKGTLWVAYERDLPGHEDELL